MSDKYINPSGLAHYDEKIKEVIDGKDKELSFDEYNALSDDDKNNGTTYYVPDATLGSDDVIFSVDDETLSATYDNKTIELVDGSKIQNNLTTTEEGYALDATQGKALNTRVTALETPTFTQATSRTNIASGETLPTTLGKIKKFFTDLKTHAFNDLANNLTTTEEGYALDARQGKALNDKIGTKVGKTSHGTINYVTDVLVNASRTVTISLPEATGGKCHLVIINMGCSHDISRAAMFLLSNIKATAYTCSTILPHSYCSVSNVTTNSMNVTFTLPSTDALWSAYATILELV